MPWGLSRLPGPVALGSGQPIESCAQHRQLTGEFLARLCAHDQGGRETRDDLAGLSREGDIPAAHTGPTCTLWRNRPP